MLNEIGDLVGGTVAAAFYVSAILYGLYVIAYSFLAILTPPVHFKAPLMVQSDYDARCGCALGVNGRPIHPSDSDGKCAICFRHQNVGKADLHAYGGNTSAAISLRYNNQGRGSYA